MNGDIKTCPDCQGWTPDETGFVCMTCDGDGVIWDEYPDDDADARDEPGPNTAAPIGEGT